MARMKTEEWLGVEEFGVLWRTFSLPYVAWLNGLILHRRRRVVWYGVSWYGMWLLQMRKKKEARSVKKHLVRATD